MRSPVKKIYITQKFGVNPDAYAKFGLKGHNGIDYRAFLPNGERCYEGGKSEVFAPHDGKIIENVFDANGYGWYVKIENDNEGSVLAHFSSQSPLKVGTNVQEGHFIGFQGTTGNSTGIHLHWGYYKKPRDRSNGYGGFINQGGLYDPWGETMATTYKGLDLTNQDSMKVAVDIWDDVINKKLYIKKADLQAELMSRFNVPDLDGIATKLGGKESRITVLTNELGTAQAEVDNKEEIIDTLNKTLLMKGDDINILTDRLDQAQNTIAQLGKDKGNLAIEVEQMKIQVETLKQQATEGKVTITVGEFLRLLLKQSITITKG